MADECKDSDDWCHTLKQLINVETDGSVAQVVSVVLVLLDTVPDNVLHFGASGAALSCLAADALKQKPITRAQDAAAVVNVCVRSPTGVGLKRRGVVVYAAHAIETEEEFWKCMEFYLSVSSASVRRLVPVSLVIAGHGNGDCLVIGGEDVKVDKTAIKEDGWQDMWTGLHSGILIVESCDSDKVASSMSASARRHDRERNGCGTFAGDVSVLCCSSGPLAGTGFGGTLSTYTDVMMKKLAPRLFKRSKPLSDYGGMFGYAETATAFKVKGELQEQFRQLLLDEYLEPIQTELGTESTEKVPDRTMAPRFRKLISSRHEGLRAFATAAPTSTASSFQLVVLDTHAPGDALLVLAGRYCLCIDGGYGKGSVSTGSAQVRNGRCHAAVLAQRVLAKEPRTSVVDVLVTHADEDHIGGAFHLVDDSLLAYAASCVDPSDSSDIEIRAKLKDRPSERALAEVGRQLRYVYLNTPWKNDCTDLSYGGVRAREELASWLHRAACQPKCHYGSKTINGAPEESKLAIDLKRYGIVKNDSTGDTDDRNVTLDRSSSFELASQDVCKDGFSVTFKVLGPSQDQLKETFRDWKSAAKANESCIRGVLTVSKESKNWHVLIMGDAGYDTATLGRVADNSLHAVQMPHHGTGKDESLYGEDALDVLVPKLAPGAVIFVSGVYGQQSGPPGPASFKAILTAVAKTRYVATIHLAYCMDEVLPGKKSKKRSLEATFGNANDTDLARLCPPGVRVRSVTATGDDGKTFEFFKDGDDVTRHDVCARLISAPSGGRGFVLKPSAHGNCLTVKYLQATDLKVLDPVDAAAVEGPADP